MYHTIRLANAVECTCHKGVILGGVAEYHQLGGTHTLVVGSNFRSLAHNLTHQLYCIHIDAGFCGADVDAAAHNIGLCQCLGNGGNQLFIAGRKALVHQCAKTADEVYTHRFCGTVQCFGVFHRVCGGCTGKQHGNGGYANALVNDRDAVIGCDFFHHRNQTGGFCGDFVVNFFASLFGVGVGTIQQADAHGHGAYIQTFGGNHADGF